MLFPNTKRINLKVSVHQFRTYGRDFRCLLAIKLLGKKARPSRESALELWCSDASCSERERQYFLHLCLQGGCIDNLLVLLKQKGDVCRVISTTSHVTFTYPNDSPATAQQTHMPLFTFLTIFPRTIVELLGIIPQKPLRDDTYFIT